MKKIFLVNECFNLNFPKNFDIILLKIRNEIFYEEERTQIISEENSKC